MPDFKGIQIFYQANPRPLSILEELEILNGHLLFAFVYVILEQFLER